MEKTTMLRTFRPVLAAVLAAMLLATSNLPAGDSPAAGSPAAETKAQRDLRMKWWREAKFGMFIHWGVYSVPAGFYNGRPIGGIGEWIMCSGKIPKAEYQKFAKKFNPVKFNADEWVEIAKEAGQKYIVITSKHHDGFAMFDSKASDWNIVKASPFHRDPLKELAAACRKRGVKLGFYYSQAQDWNNGGSACSGKWDPAQKHDMDDYIDKVAVPQVKEILSNYGEFPAVLWWDTDCDMNPHRAGKLAALLKLKPGIITNNRLGGGYPGDTETPEQEIPATGFKGRDWETCMTMNDTWGFKSDDHNWKSTETLLHNLVDIVSKGGNYLLNVGPTSEGLIPGPSIQRLREVGAWMKINGEAIYGTSPGPFKHGLPWGRATRKGKTLYLHVFDWPKDGKLVVPLANKAVKAFLLAAKADGSMELSTGKNGLTIQVPAQAPDKFVSVIALQLEGK
jgi:alpha-L-fucosidase